MENLAALEWALVGHGWKDLLSEKFCGEGVPLWAAQPVPVPFPVPLSLPYLPGARRQLQSMSGSSIIVQRDVLSTVWCRQHSSGWDGLPKRDDCFRFESWAAYQASIATGPDVWRESLIVRPWKRCDPLSCYFDHFGVGAQWMVFTACPSDSNS